MSTNVPTLLLKLVKARKLSKCVCNCRLWPDLVPSAVQNAANLENEELRTEIELTVNIRRCSLWGRLKAKHARPCGAKAKLQPQPLQLPPPLYRRLAFLAFRYFIQVSYESCCIMYSRRKPLQCDPWRPAAEMTDTLEYCSRQRYSFFQKMAPAAFLSFIFNHRL